MHIDLSKQHSLLVSWIILIALGHVMTAPSAFAAAGSAAQVRSYPRTTLVGDRAPAAVVVIPDGREDYRALAQQIVEAVQARTGATLPVESDTAVTEAHPVVREAYQARNLIVLGRLGVNRAIWPVYNRFLCAADGYYPGGDGYVLRTASNVWGRGTNVIVVGGSSDAGVARATAKLVETIHALPEDGGAVVLPWLLDVELGGECAEVFDRDEKAQMARPFVEAGHAGKPVRRFYENIMSYYWSGRESYRDLGLRYLDHVMDNLGPGGEVAENHYAIEFFVRAYDMIDDSGLLTPAKTAAVDQAIVDTFRHYGGGWEAGQRRAFTGPLEDIRQGDHSSASWLADKVMADFILTKLPPTRQQADLRATATRRLNDYIRVFDYILGHRWRSTADGDASNNVSSMVLFRYALEMERYDLWFGSGNARRAALYSLARVNPLGADVGLQFGRSTGQTAYKLLLAAVAMVTDDPQLVQVVRDIPHSGDVHYNVYVNRVHTYWPCDEVAAAEPHALIGATAVPVVRDMYTAMARDHADANLPEYDQTYDLATIRSGFSRDDDYALVSGGCGFPANTLVGLMTGGRGWLGHSAEKDPYHQNALLIRRLRSQGLHEDPLPPLARLDRLGSNGDAAIIRSTVPNYAGTDWTREVVWLKDSFCLVRDAVTAKQPDDFLMLANWRPTGGRLEGDRWVDTAGGQTFFMVAAGPQLQLVADYELDDITRETQKVLRQSASATLAKGQTFEFANLMVIRPSDEAAPPELRQAADGGWLVRLGEDASGIYYVGPIPSGLGESDAATVILNRDRAIALDARRLVIGGRTLIDAAVPESRSVTLDGGSAVADALASMWDAARSHTPADAAQAADVSDAAALHREWRFDGAQRPGLIRPEGAGPYIRSVEHMTERNTWDLGRVAALTRVSARWGRLSPRIEISTDGERFVPFRGELVDVDAPGMSNYGRTIKHEAAFQAVVGPPQPARFVRVVTGNNLSADGLLFYDADQPESPEPMRIQVVDLRGDGKPDIVAWPDIWPGFRDKVHQHTEHAFYVLDRQGQERWSRVVDWRMFFLRSLDWLGIGGRQVFVGSLDDNLYVYDAEGALTHTLTVKGTVRTDAPPPVVAGGHPLPNAVGVWQPDASGRRKIVMPRYYRTSFYDRDGSVEGHARNRSGYWTNDVLPYGVDFDGDGIEDTIAMNSTSLLLIRQDSVGGHTQLTRLPPGSVRRSLSGARTLAFDVFDRAAQTPLVLVGRKDLLAIYDWVGGTWTMTWQPSVPLSAVAALPAQRQLLAHSDDGLLWRITLDKSGAERRVETRRLPMEVHRLTLIDQTAGTVVAATHDGLLRIDPNDNVVRLVPGSFVDVQPYPDAVSPTHLIAVEEGGAIESYRWAPR